jgi:hypothetical protein
VVEPLDTSAAIHSRPDRARQHVGPRPGVRVVGSQVGGRPGRSDVGQAGPTRASAGPPQRSRGGHRQPPGVPPRRSRQHFAEPVGPTHAAATLRWIKACSPGRG